MNKKKQQPEEKKCANKAYYYAVYCGYFVYNIIITKKEELAQLHTYITIRFFPFRSCLRKQNIFLLKQMFSFVVKLSGHHLSSITDTYSHRNRNKRSEKKYIHIIHKPKSTTLTAQMDFHSRFAFLI